MRRSELPGAARPINTKHFLGIDALRFFAASIVIWFHYCFIMGVSAGGYAGTASRGLVKFPELYYFANFGWVGVEIFFVISGFVIAFSAQKSSAYDFFVSRIVRLVPGVWLCVPVTLIAMILLGYDFDEKILRSIRHSLFFLPWEPWVDGNYWTLGIEIVFYSLIFLLISVGRFSLAPQLAIALGVIGSAFCVCTFAGLMLPDAPFSAAVGKLHKARWTELSLLKHGQFFALGVILWLELVKKSGGTNIVWGALFAAGGVLEIISTSMINDANFGTHSSAIIPSFIYVGAIIFMIASVKGNAAIHRLPQPVLRVVKTAGMMTYPIYLIHNIAGAALMGWLVGGGVSRWVALGAAALTILLLAWLIAKHLEPALQQKTRDLFDYAEKFWKARRSSKQNAPGVSLPLDEDGASPLKQG